MSVDGTDLSKVTGEVLTAAAVAAAPTVVKQGGWFLSRLVATVLAVVLPLLGGVVGFVTGRTTTAPVVIEIPAGSGVGSGSGSAAAPEVRTVPYDAKSVAAEALLGPLSGTGEATHPAHPADAATAAEADAQ